MMRKTELWTCAAVIALLLSLPAFADWTITAGEARWSVQADLALVQEARAAVLWDRGNRALFGAILTAATPNLSVVDLGEGQGEIRITLPRPAADGWMDDYVAAGGCGESPTQQETLACVDEAILADLKQVVLRYRHHLREQSNPVAEPDL